MLKSFFLSQKKLLNAILRAKLNYIKNYVFQWNEQFFAMQKTDFHVFSFFAEKGILELNLHKALLWSF